MKDIQNSVFFFFPYRFTSFPGDAWEALAPAEKALVRRVLTVLGLKERAALSKAFRPEPNCSRDLWKKWQLGLVVTCSTNPRGKGLIANSAPK